MKTSTGFTVCAVLVLVLAGCAEVPNPVGSPGRGQAALTKPAKSGVWRVPGDFETIQEAIDAASVLGRATQFWWGRANTPARL